MRVVLTSVHCWPDVRRGGERYVHELSAALDRAGHDVRVLSTGAQPGADRVLGVPVRRLPVRHAPRRRFPSPWEDLAIESAFGAQALGHLAPAVLRGRVDVWHATSTGDGAAAAAVGRFAHRLRPGLRTVFTDHGFPARASRSKRPDARLHREVVRDIGAYICVSRAAAGFLDSDYGRNADVVPPGVRLADHAPAARTARPTLLYAGSLVEPRKGVDLLLEAVALLRVDVPDLEVWLLGQGDPSALVAAAPASARAAITEQRLASDAELRSAYARAWVTVLPSHSESFGMTVVESLASGTPVVVRRDSGGPAEIVTEAVGRTAEPSPADLARACAEALELATRPATVAACRDRAADFDWDARIVPAMEAVYAEAVPCRR